MQTTIIFLRDQSNEKEPLLELVKMIHKASEDAGPWVGYDGTVYCNIGSLIICI